MVLAGDVIGHEVDYHLEPGAVGAGHQPLKLGHAGGHVDGQVGVDVVVVGDGVGAAGLALDDVGIVARYAVGGVVGGMGVLYHAGVPDVGGAELAYIAQYGGVDAVELARAVLLDGAVGHGVGCIVGEQSGQKLVDYRFERVVLFHCADVMIV